MQARVPGNGGKSQPPYHALCDVPDGSQHQADPGGGMRRTKRKGAWVWHGPFKTTQQEEMRLQLARRLSAIQGY